MLSKRFFVSPIRRTAERKKEFFKKRFYSRKKKTIAIFRFERHSMRRSIDWKTTTFMFVRFSLWNCQTKSKNFIGFFSRRKRKFESLLRCFRISFEFVVNQTESKLFCSTSRNLLCFYSNLRKSFMSFLAFCASRLNARAISRSSFRIRFSSSWKNRKQRFALFQIHFDLTSIFSLWFFIDRVIFDWISELNKLSLKPLS